MGGNSEVAVFFNKNAGGGGGGGLCAGRIRAARNSLEAAWDKDGMRYGLKNQQRTRKRKVAGGCACGHLFPFVQRLFGEDDAEA